MNFVLAMLMGCGGWATDIIHIEFGKVGDLDGSDPQVRNCNVEL